MKLLTLLVVSVVSAGGAPGALKRDSEHHKSPLSIFKQARITLFRVEEGGEPRAVATAGGGKLSKRVAPGHYLIKSVANDTPPGIPSNPCGSPQDRESFKPRVGFPIEIKPGTRRVHVQLECIRK